MSEKITKGFPESQYIDMEDGARWRIFHLEGGIVTVTSAGQELLSRDENILPLLLGINQYRDNFKKKGIGNGVRQYLANGGNGTVFKLGDTGIAIKESYSSQSLYSSLQRMDRLAELIESNLPHWVSVVNHYFYVSLPNTKTEFVGMELIDGGVTVQDLSLFFSGESARFQAQRDSIEKEFSGITITDFENILDQVKEFHDLMEDVSKEKGLKLSDLMPDPNPSNILVTRLKTPVGGKKYKLWIIDQ